MSPAAPGDVCSWTRVTASGSANSIGKAASPARSSSTERSVPARASSAAFMSWTSGSSSGSSGTGSLQAQDAGRRSAGVVRVAVQLGEDALVLLVDVLEDSEQPVVAVAVHRRGVEAT